MTHRWTASVSSRRLQSCTSTTRSSPRPQSPHRSTTAWRPLSQCRHTPTTHPLPPPHFSPHTSLPYPPQVNSSVTVDLLTINSCQVLEASKTLKMYWRLNMAQERNVTWHQHQISERRHGSLHEPPASKELSPRDLAKRWHVHFSHVR